MKDIYKFLAAYIDSLHIKGINVIKLQEALKLIKEFLDENRPGYLI